MGSDSANSIKFSPFIIKYGMKYTSIKKWSIALFLTLFTVSIISWLGVKSQIKHHRGTYTEVVNSSIFNAPSSPLAITNVSVLATDCSKMLDSLTVLVKNGNIITIAKDVKITDEYKIIDGTGQYLIPGLVDTHAHLHHNKNDLLLFLANGITSIFNMNSEQGTYLEWRKEGLNGALSPRIYVAAGGMSTKKGMMQKLKSLVGFSKKYNTPSQARKAVKQFKEEGYDAIKSYAPSKEVYYAIMDEAKKQDMLVTGHLPFEVGLEGVYNSGQSGLAHVEEITKNTMHDFGGLNSENTKEYLDYLRKNVDSIAMKLKEGDIVVSSTVWIIESIPKQNFDIENFLKTIELEYQNPGQIEGSRFAKGWLPGNNGYENMDIKNDAELTKKHKLFWKAYVDALHIMTRALVRNGVTVITGTDSNTAGVVAGFSLHDEFESLNKCGMTTSQILYAATVAPAKWMQSDAGKIEVGYRADLVLLRKNPLEDINNTRSIHAVISNGKFLDREELDKMLQAIKDANKRSRKINIDEFTKN
jgi:hypothetical protein